MIKKSSKKKSKKDSQKTKRAAKKKSNKMYLIRSNPDNHLQLLEQYYNDDRPELLDEKIEVKHKISKSDNRLIIEIFNVSDYNKRKKYEDEASYHLKRVLRETTSSLTEKQRHLFTSIYLEDMLNINRLLYLTGFKSVSDLIAANNKVYQLPLVNWKILTTPDILNR